MIPEIMIIESLKMFKISQQVLSIITRAMEKLRVKIAVRVQTVEEVKKSKKHLLRRFIIANTNYSKNVSILYTNKIQSELQFGLEVSSWCNG